MVDDVAYDIIRLFCEKNSEAAEKEEGGTILHVNSSWVPTIEEVEKLVFSKYSSGEVSKEEIKECYADIIELIESGKLFSSDIFRPNANTLKNRHTDIKALCLHVSHACDLTCSYCFAGQGKFNGPSALMTYDVAKRAIDFLVENSGSRRNLEVDFFGGEPLLNFDVVKETVSYARSIEEEKGKHFRFTLTTNGTGITDEVIEFANKECHNVVLSLDGRKEVHDRERRTASGEGSYDIIVPKFQKMVAARTNNDNGNTNYYMRGTFTHYNPDFTNDLYHMVDLGFTELSMEPVVCDPESRFALTEEDLPILLEDYEKLAVEMLRRERTRGTDGKDRPFTFYHYMIDLENGPCIYKRVSGCGSGTEYFAVTPKGELYPCHQFVGDEKYLMGDIWEGISERASCDGGKSGTDIRNEFKKCNVYSRNECDDCWAKFYCSGGCAANAYHASGDILGIYEYGCKLFRKRMECAIMMEIARAVERDEDENQ